MTEPILHIKGISKSFGGVQAVEDCTLAVQPGKITGLIGPNGAGKSTLFNVIIGYYPAEKGEVWFDGRRIDGLPPYRIVRMGLSKTFQIPREFQRQTVLENLLVATPFESETLGHLFLRPFRARDELARAMRRAEEILGIVGLSELRDEYAGNLSGGQKKLLELARSLMPDPKFLMLDEPVAGVNPSLTNQLLQVIESLRDREGKTFFLVEHDMDVVMRHCDHIIVLYQGRQLTEGTPQEVRTDPAVIESYLGG